MEFSQNRELLSNTLALNVALQTIKERCVHLQKRLYALESENSQLRLNNVNADNNSKKSRNSDSSLIAEVEDLRAKNAELTLQKSQLTENLSMISVENRKLWRRLSHLTKENNDGGESSAKDEENDERVTKQHANLIRSKTFTQNSPHQLLREKLVGNQIGPDADSSDDLEDISLINDCGFATAPEGGEGMDSETCDVDTKTCTDGLLSIKKEILRQNSELKVAISNWRKSKNSLEVCSCKTKQGDNKPVMVDKSLETDRNLTLEFEMDEDVPINNNIDISDTKQASVLDERILLQKRAADDVEKICPMCGKFYTQNILFEEFQEHVESHFRDDSDIEQLSLDHNFELVSHSVGNF